MYPDFKELLSILNEHRVKYLVVGAYAVAIHAQPRATKDLDILVKADADNARRFLQFFRMGCAPVGVDVLTKIPGIEFDAAWQRRVEDVVDEKTGLKANFISADDLIASKQAAGRLQDLADVDAVQKAQRLRPAKKKHPGSKQP